MDLELRPFADTVAERFDLWLARQEAAGRTYSAEQRRWLEAIRDHVAASIDVSAEDLELTPFIERGGLGRAYQLFGPELNPLLEEINEALAA